MRKNQVTIKVERFGDQEHDGKHMTYGVYADGDDLSEVLHYAFKKINDALGLGQNDGNIVNPK